MLLLENEDDVPALAGETLNANGYSVLSTGKGDEALRLGEQYGGAIRLRLTDVAMPHMSGRELAESMGSLRPQMKVQEPFTEEAFLLRRREVPATGCQSSPPVDPRRGRLGLRLHWSGTGGCAAGEPCDSARSRRSLSGLNGERVYWPRD